MPGGHGYGPSGYLGIRPGTYRRNIGFGDPGTDPRERLRAYQQSLTAQQGTSPAYQQRRGGAPTNNPAMTSPTVDSIDSIEDYAQLLRQQDPAAYLNGVGSGELPSLQGATYLPGFQAPRRRIFARRGYRGLATPLDQFEVHEGETVQVDQPVGIQVTPRGQRRRGGSPMQTLPLVPGQQGGRMQTLPLNPNDQRPGGLMLLNAPGFRPEDTAAANAQGTAMAAQREATARAQLQAQMAARAQSRRIGDQYVGGGTPSPETISQVQGVESGSLPGYAATSPAARRAAAAIQARGGNPTRDRRIADATAAAQARLPMAQANLRGSRKTGETDEAYRGRLAAEGFAPDAIDEFTTNQQFRPVPSEAEMSDRQKKREAAHARALERKQRTDALLTERAQERREAVQTYGTARPRAIEALRQKKRQEVMDSAGLEMAQQQVMNQTLSALYGGKTGSGRQLDMTKILSSESGVTNLNTLIESAISNPLLLPLLPPEIAAEVEAAMAAQQNQQPQPNGSAAPGLVGDFAGAALRGAATGGFAGAANSVAKDPSLNAAAAVAKIVLEQLTRKFLGS